MICFQEIIGIVIIYHIVITCKQEKNRAVIEIHICSETSEKSLVVDRGLIEVKESLTSLIVFSVSMTPV